MSETLDLIKQLITCRSVTPDDGGCQPLIAERLAPLEFRSEWICSNGTSNLWLRRGRTRPCIVFAGHTDVVPPGPSELWASDPFQAIERDGMLFGRGAADMKASVAAFVVAIEEFVRARPGHSGSIALLLTSDEEGPATDGTVRVVERLQARNEEIDAAIIGEPTSVECLGDTIKYGRRGSLSGRLKVIGIQGHVAYPHLASNPVHRLAPALAELTMTRWDNGDEHFPATTFQVSNVRAGTGASNVIPGSCDIEFNLRFAPASPADSLIERIEAILRRHGIDDRPEWTVGATPFLTPLGSLVEALSAAILETTGINTSLSTSGGTSDGRFIAAICPQVVEFGPVNATIHKTNESIRVADIEPLKTIYRLMLEKLLAPER